MSEIPMADVIIKIKATVPLFALRKMFEEATSMTPRDGELTIKVSAPG